MLLELNLDILADLFIDLQLFRGQLDHLLIADLVRQVIQHLILGTSEDERHRPVLQFPLHELIPWRLDVLVDELLPWSEHARIDELEEVPHLAEVILKRSTRKDYLGFTFQ